MDGKKLRELLNRITVRRYVNLYFPQRDENSQEKAGTIATDIVKKIQTKYYVFCINIQELTDNEDEMVRGFINSIKNGLSEAKAHRWIHNGRTIDGVLEQLSENLDKPALIIFFLFKDEKDEKEKRILLRIRRFIETKSSLLLGLLIISIRKVEEWDLFPYSNIDERHIEFFEYQGD